MKSDSTFATSLWAAAWCNVDASLPISTQILQIPLQITIQMQIAIHTVFAIQNQLASLCYKGGLECQFRSLNEDEKRQNFARSMFADSAWKLSAKIDFTRV